MATPPSSGSGGSPGSDPGSPARSDAGAESAGTGPGSSFAPARVLLPPALHPALETPDPSGTGAGEDGGACASPGADPAGTTISPPERPAPGAAAQGSPSSARSPAPGGGTPAAGPPSGDSGRRVLGAQPPLLMRTLAVVSLLLGLWGALSALAQLNSIVFLERGEFVTRVRDRQLALYDQAVAAGPSGDGRLARPFIEPILRLPRADAEKLSLQVGDELYQRRRVTVPLGLLQLILSWLLLNGSLGLLRRKLWALPTWSWACMVNIPFALLSMLVTYVHSHTLLQRVQQPAAEALARVSGRAVESEALGIDQLVRMYVMMQAALEALWVLLLGVTALYLQRYLPTLVRERDRED